MDALPTRQPDTRRVPLAVLRRLPAAVAAEHVVGAAIGGLPAAEFNASLGPARPARRIETVVPAAKFTSAI